MPISFRIRLQAWQWVLVALVALLPFIALIALWNGLTTSSVALDSPVPIQSLKKTQRRVSPTSVQSQSVATKSPIDTNLSVELRPAEVIGNVECRMTVGRGRAFDSAVVVVPALDGARFSVLDADGTLVSDSLPFQPHIVELGMQADGTPVLGFGDLRLNSNTFREANTEEPVRILVGDQIIYESEKVWDFLVAPDGSSFAVHEPLAGDGSRLIVNNLQTGEERHFDLGTRFTPSNNYEPSHAMKYSQDGSEIMFHLSESDARGLGTYWFYPTGEGKVRRFEVEGGMGAVLTSSSEGYFVDQPPELNEGEHRGTWRVTKRRFDTGEGSIDDVWRRTLDLNSFGGDMFASNNGRWLAVDGWDFHVLDTDTGKTVFAYPVVGSVEEQLARLGSVAGEAASSFDLGRLAGIRFQGNDLLFFRKFGRSDCSTRPGEQYDERRYRECLRALRISGAHRAVYDIYDMDRISVHAMPYHRAEVHLDGDCVLSNSPIGGLLERRGRLAYVSARSSLNRERPR